jgi:hypothetical protein
MAIDLQTLQAALTGYQMEQARITKAIADLQVRIRGGKAPRSSGPDHAAMATKPKRKLSAAARKRMAASQKKRWAEYHEAQKAEE